MKMYGVVKKNSGRLMGFRLFKNMPNALNHKDNYIYYGFPRAKDELEVMEFPLDSEKPIFQVGFSDGKNEELLYFPPMNLDEAISCYLLARDVFQVKTVLQSIKVKE